MCLTVLIASEFSMTKTIGECLKAERSDGYKLNEIQSVWSVETKPFSAFNSLTDQNEHCHFRVNCFYYCSRKLVKCPLVSVSGEQDCHL